MFRRSCKLFYFLDIGEGLFKVLAAQFLFCFKGNAYFRPLRCAEQRAEILRCEVDTACARRFALEHTRNGAGDRDGDTAGSAARATFNGIDHIIILGA